MTIGCGACAFANPDQARFCGNCGAALTAACGACGHANPVTYNFCINCGTALGERREAAAPGEPEPAAAGGWPMAVTAAVPADATSWPVISDLGPERRQLTVLFCDLVGSTALSQELDPEDLRVVMRAYETASSEAIERFGGYVAQYYGDGVLAYFGYPVAHEDAAERAVRAGLALIEAVAAVPSAHPLQVRIGIHSGLVVVGMEKSGVPGKANSAVGETPNTAARIQTLAEPNTVLVSAATNELLRGRFEVADAGAHALRGVAAKVQLFRIDGEAEGPRREDREAQGEMAPLVGRGQDLKAILHRWERARGGDGQVVLLGGEAGIGKSRLVNELRRKLDDTPHVLMRHHCSPYHQTSPLHPFAEAIAGAAEIAAGDPPAERLAGIGRWLARYGLESDEALALLADLLNVPACDQMPRLSLSPEQRKQRLFALLLAAVERAARDEAVLFVVADLQWADPTSIEFVGLVIDQLPTLRALALLTFRPSFQPPWPPRAHVLPLTLARLDAADSAAMAEHVAGGKRLPEAVLTRIVERGDGVPLFIEELTRTVLASGFLAERDGAYALVGALPPVAIPASLQDSLMARLDRLGPYKEVAQIGAMLGRSFRYDVLAAVSGLEASALDEALAALVANELLLQRGLPPQASYVFRQALVQEVAYQTLLRSRRQALHARIAEALEQRFPDIAEAEPEAVARHYAAAGMPARALDHCRRATARAIAASAMSEALMHADSALAMIAAADGAPETRRDEMELQVMRGIARAAIKGFGDSQARDAYARALDISLEIGAKEIEFRALIGLFGHAIGSGRPAETREISDRLLALAEDVGRDDVLLAAYVAAGVSRNDHGEIAAAADYFERALGKLGCLEPAEAQSLIAQDPGVVAWSMLAHDRFMLGFADRAREASRGARERGELVANAYSLTFALCVAGAVHASMRDWTELARWSGEAAALADAHGFRSWQVHAAVYHGLAEVQLGRVREGLAEIERGRALGEHVFQTGLFTYFRVAFAEALLAAGRLDEALAEVDGAADQLEARGGWAYEAELHRLRGTILAAMSRAHDRPEAARAGLAERAEQELETAIEAARARNTLAWELRAALALARLRGSAAALRRLRAVYGRFEEGLETADLAEARALLDTVPA